LSPNPAHIANLQQIAADLKKSSTKPDPPTTRAGIEAKVTDEDNKMVIDESEIETEIATDTTTNDTAKQSTSTFSAFGLFHGFGKAKGSSSLQKAAASVAFIQKETAQTLNNDYNDIDEALEEYLDIVADEV
jgi:hypothetical protein